MRRFVSLAALVVFAGPAFGQTADEKKASVAFLQSLQQADGGFFPVPKGVNTDGKLRSSLRATSSALRALKYFGGEPKDAVAAGKFVESCFDPASGGFKDHPGGSPEIGTTAVGLMALVELKMPLDKYKGPAVTYLFENAKTFEEVRIAAAGMEAVQLAPPRAVLKEWLRQMPPLRDKSGGFIEDTRQLGGTVAAMLRLGWEVPDAQEKSKCVAGIQAGQRADGGFGKADAKGSDLETSYRVTRALMMLGAKPKDPEAMKALIAKCRNADGGYGVAPGQPSAVASTYYAATVAHWMGKE
jgi:prenyltransferase beta subunit